MSDILECGSGFAVRMSFIDYSHSSFKLNMFLIEGYVVLSSL
jgi:hypothetical protein